MNKLQKRRSKTNRHKTNSLGVDQQLTPSQACAYAAKRGAHININILALLRRDGMGPRYLKIEGGWIRYTRRFLDPYLDTRQPRLIDPAARRRN